MLVFLYEPVEIFGGVLAAVGIVLFVEVYIQEKALSAWLMVGNYIVLSVLYLLVLSLQIQQG